MTDSDICFDYSNIIPFFILFYSILCYFTLFCSVCLLKITENIHFCNGHYFFLKKTRYRDSY